VIFESDQGNVVRYFLFRSPLWLFKITEPENTKWSFPDSIKQNKNIL